MSLRNWRIFLGQNEIDIYGGNKGGYAYLVFWDKKNSELLSYYVTPPTRKSRSVKVDASAGIGLGGGVNYQSEVEYGEPFVVLNSDNKLGINDVDPLTKGLNQVRESRHETKIEPTEIHSMRAEQSFIAGSYLVPVSPTEADNPLFKSHFDNRLQLPAPLKDGLTLFLEFIIKNFWKDQQKYRASIFLYDARALHISQSDF